MSAPKFTPGPWCLMSSESTNGWRNLSVCQKSMPFIRVCFLTSDGPNEDNGHLIAAAPEMYDALIAVRKLGMGKLGRNRVLNMVDAALAKAVP